MILMKKFNQYNKDRKDRFEKDLNYFKSINPDFDITDRVLEFFDTDDYKSQWEIPYLQGELGKNIVKGDDWQPFPKHPTKLQNLVSKLASAIQWLQNFEVEGFDGDTRVRLSLHDETSTAANYMIESKATLDVTMDDYGSISFFFDCYVKGISRLENVPKEYTIMKDHFTQGVLPMDRAIEVLNNEVKSKMDLWNTEVKKWTNKELLMASDSAKQMYN
jgi:hypothetical protein